MSDLTGAYVLAVTIAAQGALLGALLGFGGAGRVSGASEEGVPQIATVFLVACAAVVTVHIGLMSLWVGLPSVYMLLMTGLSGGGAGALMLLRFRSSQSSTHTLAFWSAALCFLLVLGLLVYVLPAQFTWWMHPGMHA